MIYCLGKISFYEYLFSQDLTPMKPGREGRYPFPGGSVWRTYDEAKDHVFEGFTVYGVLAEWEQDTVPSTRGPWHELLYDRILIKLPDMEI